MPKEFIVAIELGSTKIVGVAAKKNADGSTSVLAVAKENASACIRKGVVYNIDKTVICLRNVIQKLEQALQTKIARVYVGVGGQGIRCKKNEIIKDYSQETHITQEHIDEMRDMNRAQIYPGLEILDVAVQEYQVDNKSQIDAIGCQCTMLKGNFLNILWRSSFYKNLNKCMEKAGITIAEMYLSPLALAECILTENERRSGCILVDMGAETTTLAVYYKNILRHLVVIPLGGANITKDLTSLKMEEEEAEELKIKYGSAYTEGNEINGSQHINIDKTRTISSSDFISAIEARVTEIIENIKFQVSEFELSDLLGGIILTGGASNMKNIETAFTKILNISKIRTAKFVPKTINSTSADITAKNAMMNTVLALIEKGNMNCAGKEITGSLFGEDETIDATPVDTSASPISTSENTTGRVLTEEEKRRIKEEEERKREEEERRRREEEEQRRREEEERRRREKENSFWGKIKKKAKDFGKQIMDEEE